ncbi:conserved hypothetical protein [Streptomyces sp. F-3]|nr:conserved hypothetical protein [Streptomyces sp. F-3]
MVAVGRAVRRSGPGNPEDPAEVPSLRFGGFEPTGPRATRVSAPGGRGSRPRSAPLPTRVRTTHGALSHGSLIQRMRVAGSGTQIIYMRRILLGHSLRSPAGNTAPPPPVMPRKQRKLVSSLSRSCRSAPRG